MWVLVAIVAVSVLAALAARRRSMDARDSVDMQRQRLDALRTAASGTDLATGRRGDPAARFRPMRPRRNRGWRRPIAPRPAVFVAATVLVLVGAVGLVLVLVSSDGTTNGTPARQAGRPRSKAAPHPSSTSTTSTTAPRGAVVVGTQAGVITVSVPAGGYRLKLTAHGPCWMRAQRSDNTVVATTTLHAGDSRELAESGALTVRLGNPTVVDVAVDGQVLALPLPNGAAVDLHLVPPGSPN